MKALPHSQLSYTLGTMINWAPTIPPSSGRRTRLTPTAHGRLVRQLAATQRRARRLPLAGPLDRPSPSLEPLDDRPSEATADGDDPRRA